jgi:Nif-specific regulatory protein
MHPRLFVREGPQKGSTFLIVCEETILGREPKCDFCISDDTVSKEHCSIRKHRDGFSIHDHDSRNGVFVNGLPVRKRTLKHGDEIRIGRCYLLFLTAVDEPSGSDSFQVKEEVYETRQMVCLPRQDAVYLKPGEIAETSVSPHRVVQDLKTLLRATSTLHAIRDCDSLARQLLELILDVVPAQRGAILLMDPGFAQPKWAFGWERTSGEGYGPASTLAVHTVFVARSYSEGIGLLSNDVTGSGPLSSVSSLLVAPLFSLDRPLGVIYLDTRDPRVVFDENHLQLVTAIGGFSGLAFETAGQMAALASENIRLREEIAIDHDMVGESEKIDQVYKFIAKMASSSSTVLILGESGTGKELVARAIHRNSSRSSKPFVAISCPAIPESLFESELFGYERGAFSGAFAMKRGKLEIADGGTVFLDEIGELPLPVQAKLLRVIQEHEFDRLGGVRSIKSDFRLIAATNRDLPDAVAKGTFRADLLFRLKVASLTMPPLRERRDDIPLLASHFIDKYSKRSKRDVMGLSSEARAYLVHYDWPGNVRELESAIESAVGMANGNVIMPEDLPEAIVDTGTPASASVSSYHAALRREKERLILTAFCQASGSHQEAAKLLNLHPNYLHRLIRNLKLKETLKAAVGD